MEENRVDSCPDKKMDCNNGGLSAANENQQLATASTDFVEASRNNYILPRSGGWPQRLHVGAMLVLSAIAFYFAAAEVIAGQVRGWEVWIFATMYVFANLGITVGFHRFLTHRAFKAGSFIKALLIILGSMSGQGPAIYWVGLHRRHHRFSDQALDPHSPLWMDDRPARNKIEGFFHSQIGWAFTHRMTNTIVFCKDLYRDHLVVWLSQRYFFWLFLGLLIPTIVGAVIEQSAWGAWKGLLWGGGLRLFFSYHFINSVNSISHLFGYRSFATRENSRNNAWLALPTFGETWHNNHHAYPRSAFFGLRWWEIDIGGLVVRLLEMLGLVSSVVRADQTVLDDLSIREFENFDRREEADFKMKSQHAGRDARSPDAASSDRVADS
ncbi:MAG: acyl-CoA desaturase [Pseudomonadota bacterium]